MSTPPAFRGEYVAALRVHVVHTDERTLRSGYELGRRAVTDGISALELAGIHHEALASALAAAEDRPAAAVLNSAATFFEETLSSFEMLHRGYREAAAAAAAERRHASMIRLLSSFLADAALAARDNDAPAEVLRLVAEHARELAGAEHCVASCAVGGKRVRAASSESDTVATRATEAYDLIERVAPTLPQRIDRSDWSEEPSLRAVHTSLGRAVSILTVPIAALDGRPLGVLQLVDKGGRDFTDADEAIAVHLAGMTAASLERAESYRIRGART